VEAKVKLEAESLGDRVPFLTTVVEGSARISVLNVFTFDHEDYLRRYFWMYAPDEHGLTKLPQPWVDELRAAFDRGVSVRRPDLPPLVSRYPILRQFGAVCNYGDEPASGEVTMYWDERIPMGPPALDFSPPLAAQECRLLRGRRS